LGHLFDSILRLIKARMMPDYWIECLYSEGTGCDWTAPIHKINQKGKACCHWFEERKVEGALTEQWIVIVRGRRREINKIKMVVEMRGGDALPGGKAMDKDCGQKEEGE